MPASAVDDSSAGAFATGYVELGLGVGGLGEIGRDAVRAAPASGLGPKGQDPHGLAGIVPAPHAAGLGLEGQKAGEASAAADALAAPVGMDTVAPQLSKQDVVVSWRCSRMGKSEYQLLIGASGKCYVMGGSKNACKKSGGKEFYVGKELTVFYAKDKEEPIQIDVEGGGGFKAEVTASNVHLSS